MTSVRAKRIRAEIPEALYESGKSQLSMRVPHDPAEQFPAIVRAADVLLAVLRGAEAEAGSGEADDRVAVAVAVAVGEDR